VPFSRLSTSLFLYDVEYTLPLSPGTLVPRVLLPDRYLRCPPGPSESLGNVAAQAGVTVTTADAATGPDYTESTSPGCGNAALAEMPPPPPRRSVLPESSGLR